MDPTAFLAKTRPFLHAVLMSAKDLDKETKTSTSSNPVVVFITHTYDCGRAVRQSCTVRELTGDIVRKCAEAVLQCTYIQWNSWVRLYRLSFLTSSSHIMTCLTVRLLDSVLLGTEKLLVRFRKRLQFG